MRFKFGKNWKSFSKKALSTQKITSAKEYFYRLVSPEELKGRRFIDIGFGQGLGLCIAVEAGANAYGIDVDRENLEALDSTVAYFPSISRPKVEVASILDMAFITREVQGGCYDIVHSWGVLHHTGAMREAIANCLNLVRPNGLLIISIYNRHWSSPVWRVVKRLYNGSPQILQHCFIAIFYPIIVLAKFIVTRENPFKKERGMDFYHDVVDWVGGYPYECASAEEIKGYVENFGFKQQKFFAAQVPTGCNEFVFKKVA